MFIVDSWLCIVVWNATALTDSYQTFYSRSSKGTCNENFDVGVFDKSENLIFSDHFSGTLIE